MPNELKKITALTDGTPADTDVIPFVDLATNTTKKALKSELKGDKGETGTAATVDAGTTTTLAAGQSATVTNVGTTSAAIFNFAIPQGIQGVAGANGADGACVESVAFVGDDMVFTLDDASTVTLTGAKTDLKGDTGATGAVIESAEFVGDDLVFTLSDASTVTITGAKTALKGDKGDTGLTGIDWQGNWSAGTYTTNQGVAHNSSSWIATTTTTEEPSISATDWDLIALKGTDGAGSGTVTSVAALTLGTTGTDLSSTVADGTTTPVITLQVPTASATNRGALSSTDWSTFNGKQDALGFTPEDVANKKTSITDSDTDYPTGKAVKTALDGKAPLASPTFTGTVVLPKTTEIQDTSANHQYVLGVSELTADRTVTLPLLTGNDEFTFKAHTQTLTNKRINPRLVTTASYTTDTGTSLDVSTCDQFEVTAQAGALKFNNPGGTPLGGQKLVIRIKDNGTARALTYDTQFRAMGVALPSTTVLSKTLYMGFIFNATDTKWDCVAVAQES